MVARNYNKMLQYTPMIICFIGHRAMQNVEQVRVKLRETISRLILAGADTFLFGSRSAFDTLCWQVVTELQTQYPNTKRVSYNAPHESAITSKEERQQLEQISSKLVGSEVRLKDYEAAVNSQKSINATKDTYIMRNQEMIDNSDVCVFYYNKDYLPPRRKQSKRNVFDYQPRSGTSVAYAYAKRKKKTIINLFDYFA